MKKELKWHTDSIGKWFQVPDKPYFDPLVDAYRIGLLAKGNGCCPAADALTEEYFGFKIEFYNENGRWIRSCLDIYTLAATPESSIDCNLEYVVAESIPNLTLDQLYKFPQLIHVTPTNWTPGVMVDLLAGVGMSPSERTKFASATITCV